MLGVDVFLFRIWQLSWRLIDQLLIEHQEFLPEIALELLSVLVDLIAGVLHEIFHVLEMSLHYQFDVLLTLVKLSGSL